MAENVNTISADCAELADETLPVISVVIPAFNEEWTLHEVIRGLDEVCAKLASAYEIVVCDDGSSDNTLPVLRYLQTQYPYLRVLTNAKNLGVGGSLQRLYRESRGHWVAFWPADNQIAASELVKLWQAREYNIVIGRRIPRCDSIWRRLASGGFNWLVRVMWQLRVYDVDSVVLYSRTALKGEFRSRDLCLPVEILYKAHRKGLSYTEVPIGHLPRRSGKAAGCNPRTAVRTLLHMCAARILNTWNI